MYVDQSIYASVADASGSSIPSGVKSIRTQFFNPTYTTPATLVGGANYARMSKAAIDTVGYPAVAYFRSTDRFMPDGTTDGVNGGYWVVADAAVYPEMFGAKGDGITDDSTAFNSAAIFVSLLGGGNLNLRGVRYNTGTTTVSIPKNVSVAAVAQSEILYTGMSTALEIVGDPASLSGAVMGRFMVLPNVIRTTTAAPLWNTGVDTTSAGVVIRNCNYDNFVVQGVRAFYRGLYLVTDGANVFCNTFQLGRLINNQISIDMLDTLNTYGCNQNTFIGGVCRIDSAYTTTSGRVYVNIPRNECNSNLFLGVNLEKGGNEKGVYCNSINNVFVNCRFEGAAATAGYVEFGSGGINNRIVGGHPSATSNGPFDTMVLDAGYGNSYNWSNVLAGKFTKIDFNSATKSIAFGNGTAAPSVPICGYGATRLLIGDSTTTAIRHYGPIYNEAVELTIVVGSRIPIAGDVIKLNMATAQTILGQTGGADATVGGKLTLFDLNGNVTLTHSAAPASGAGLFLLKAGVNLVMSAKVPVIFTLINGNYYQD